MILVGQYDSPYVRRVAISLRVLGIPYQHDTRSVFGDFDDMRKTNPLGRIPSLILDNGETLIDSAAILDRIDEIVGPSRALVPPHGAERRATLRRIALATGVIDKAGGGVVYERLVRPSQYRWPDWIERCRTQAAGALAALDREDWPAGRFAQAEITAGAMLYYLKINAPTYCAPARSRRSTSCCPAARRGPNSRRQASPNTRFREHRKNYSTVAS
ncbi:MAG: glutathione S-transferase family protein [Alphaproteobacteria bacterium]|nr:glutathione S-transferase family protein [Alphaproteobacteria bacterium]MBL6938343.1 glutathione S-transferase family protein [Alphaproteobacteria bacterium]MBL7096402.1 glutathione S-transferase family protein [Alphaproteobacteria bacterium]